MDPGDKARIEIEAVLKDSMTTVVRSIGREFQNVTKLVQEFGMVGASSMLKARRENDQFGETTKRNIGPLKETAGLFKSLAENLGGPLGVAAGFYQVTQALQSFASSRVQLQMFSKDVGFSVEKIGLMRATFADMGMSLEKSDALIAGVGGKLKDLFTMKVGGSELGQNLLRLGEGEWATKLLAVVETGDYAKAWDMILKKGNTGSEEFRTKYASMLGIPESVFESYARLEPAAKAAFEGAYKPAEAYLHNMNVFEQNVSDIWTKIKEAMVGALDDKFFAEANAKIRKEVDDAKSIFHFVETAKFPTSEPLEKLNLPKHKSPFWIPDPSSPSDADRSKGLDLLRKQMTPGAGEHGITDFGGMARTHDESVDIDKDSNKSLRDIRDTLQRMELKEAIIPGTGSVGGRGGHSVDSPLQASGGGFRRAGVVGARSGDGVGARGGALQAGAGGFRRQTGGGNAAAAEAAGGGHDDAAVEASGGGAGINRDKWLKELQGNPALKEELFRHAIGENDNPQANQAVMEEAANRASLRGNKSFADKGNLSYFQGHRNFNKAERAMMESNFDKVFRQGSDISKGAIDNSSQGLSYVHEHGGQMGKYGRPGLPPGRFKTTANFGGDRITGHRGVESFEVPGWGDSGSGDRENYPEFRRKQLEEAEQRNAARNGIDKAQSMAAPPAKVDASLDVDFKNMPSWVKTGVDGGAFKQLKVTRSTPQAGKAEAGNSSPAWNDWAY